MTPSPPETREGELAELLEAIFHRYHYDFRRYAEASIRRRLQSAITQLGCADLAQLRERLLAEPRVFTQLLRYLTVQVSDLFRDPTYFLAVRRTVLPYLATYPSFKIWVAGCATGEEAYSLAIILKEEGLLDRALIYATDINPESLRTAEEGVYELARFVRFSENYQRAGGKGSLADHYTASNEHAVLDRSLKRSILFSDHSLATDSVFAEVQLASCRNVLIYFERQLQDRALGVLSEALCRHGFLGLGQKESLRFSAHARSFVAISPEDRIYQKK